MAPAEFGNLLDRIRQHDSDALAEVYRSANQYCIRTLRRKTSCKREDAEDLFMDAILVFRENILQHKLESLTNLNSYLYGICWNLWRERNRINQKWDNARDEVERQLLLMAYQGDIPFAEEEVRERQQSIQLVLTALRTLGERCQKLLRLVYVEKRSHQEISDLLGFASANVVKVTRHRCYQQWMKQVQHHANTQSS